MNRLIFGLMAVFVMTAQAEVEVTLPGHIVFYQDEGEKLESADVKLTYNKEGQATFHMGEYQTTASKQILTHKHGRAIYTLVFPAKHEADDHHRKFVVARGTLMKAKNRTVYFGDSYYVFFKKHESLDELDDSVFDLDRNHHHHLKIRHKGGFMFGKEAR